KRGAHVASSGIFGRETVVAGARDHVVAPRISQAHERVWIVHRQFFQEQPVDGAEERRVRADTERERDHDDSRPAFGLEQHPYPVTQISEHVATDYRKSRLTRRDCGPTIRADVEEHLCALADRGGCTGRWS